MRQGASRAQVYWVASGEEALDFLRQRKRFENVGPVKVIILDLHLPGQDGFEILRQIKSDPNLNRVPVIMLTSAISRDEVDLAYSLGANAYFKKPTTLESYIELLLVLAQHWLDLAELPTMGHEMDLREARSEQWRRTPEHDR